MHIFTKAIVSNSDMIKNFKNCRKMADLYGKIFILKNNQPDAVLFSIAEYERLAVIIELLEHLNEIEIADFADSLAQKRYSRFEKKEISKDLAVTSIEAE